MPDYAVKTSFMAIDRITVPMSKMTSAVARFGQRADSIMSKIGHAMLGPLQAMLPALSAVGIIEFGNQCIEKFEKSEVAVANMEAGLKSTHNTIGITSLAIQDMAGKLADKTIFTKSAILNLQTQLMTFGGIHKENFERISMATMEVTAKLKKMGATEEDLQETAIMMGKALDNPAEGLTRLSKKGILFSDAQKQQIKSMVAHNNVIGAQNIMLTEIESKYGDVNKALLETSAGKQLQAQKNIAKNMALIGKNLVPLKDTLLEVANDVLPAIGKYLPTVISLVKKLEYPVIALAVAWGIYKLTQLYSMVATAANSVAIVANTAVTWGAQLALFAVTAATWAWGIALQVGLWPLTLLAIAIAALVGFTYLAIQHWHEFGAAMTLFLGPVGEVIAVFKTVYDRWDQIKQAFQTDGIVGGIYEIGKSILDGLLYPIQQLLEIIAKLPIVGKYAAEAAGSIQGFREGKLNAPNQTEAEGKYSNNTNVNVYSNGTEARAEVTPKGGAKVNTGRTGDNP